MILNRRGQIAATCWEEIPSHFPQVTLDVFVVMPNHIHGLVVIDEDNVRTRHAVSVQSDSPNRQFGPPIAGSLSTIVGAYKSAVSKNIRRIIPDFPFPLWHGRFHDHIIRNEKALSKIQEYVLNNDALWEQDTFYGNDQNP